jgi:aspartate/tyrosine/aromatic aminotransferase
MFDELTLAPPDPILGLTEAFNKDPRPEKINLAVGVYQDDTGRTPIFSTVKKAERSLLEQETTKNYLPMTGTPDYGALVQEMVLGKDSDALASKRAVTAHTPGGTGALRVAGDFLKKFRPAARLWVSQPTWPNHNGIFQAAGFQVASYPYYDATANTLDFAAMVKGIEAIPEGDIILLHGSCHNPTGLDPTADQWRQIAELVWRRRLMPLLDFAYQGLAVGIEEDAAGVRVFAAAGREAIIASSFSKNFGLYRERVGALTLLGVSADAVGRALSHLKITIRQNYSNPAAHGGLIVTTILKDAALRKEWEGEVTAMRDRIRRMRRLFVDTLKAKGVARDFSFITKQNGMFSFSGLTKDQVLALREKHAIFIVDSGRINVAGMTEATMDRLCSAIAEVLK